MPGAIKNKLAALYFPWLLFCKLFTHPITLLPPPLPLKPLHNTTYKTHANAKANQLPQSPACPRLPSVHARQDAQRDPSPQRRLIKLRCATTFQKKKKRKTLLPSFALLIP